MKNYTTFPLRFGIVMLMIFVWAMPLLADFNLPTRLGTNNPNKIDNPNIEAERKNNFEYKAYKSTIYDPFGNQTPSSGGGGNPANNDGNGSGEDVGIPDWGDTPSEPLPIADGTLFLLLIAATMITIIAIKQRKQKQLQSITTNNNNNPTQHMTTRKQTYQSLRQKLFLLLVFCSFATNTFAWKPIMIGHRGCRQGVENTMEAFENGIEVYGFQALECDVKITADDQYICWHDDNLDRAKNEAVIVKDASGNQLTNVVISSTDISTLQTYTLTQTRNSVSYTGKICTLREFLSLCKDNDITPVVELKYNNDKNIQEESEGGNLTGLDGIYDIIKELNMEDKVIILGFKAGLIYFHDNFPNIQCMWLTNSITDSHIQTCEQYGWWIDSQPYLDYDKGTAITAAQIKKCQDAGVKVGLWTINNTTNCNIYAGYGVNFITSDDIKYSQVTNQTGTDPNNTKTIYFRPSTVCIDGGIGANGSAANDVAWVRSSSPRLYFVVEKTSDNRQVFHGSTDTKTTSPNILVPNTTTNITAKGQISRFIKVTLGDDSQFACYRTQKSSASLSDNSNLQDCVPNSKWWNDDSKKWDDDLIAISTMGDKNLIAIREGYWASGKEDNYKGYYFGYFLEEDAHIYFENKNDWTAPTFLRSKDIYAYTHDMIRIGDGETDLWYCKLEKPTDDVESGIAYTQYAFISDRTTKCNTNVKGQTAATAGLEDPYLWKRWPHISVNSTYTDLSYSNRNNHNFGKLRTGKNYTGTITNDKLSGKTNLYIPGTSSEKEPTKIPLSNWQELNHTQRIIVTKGGQLNYSTTKLTGNGTSDTYSKTGLEGTVECVAAYTAKVRLRALPKEGYEFLGFYNEESNELVDRGTKASSADGGGYTYVYKAENASTTIVAVFGINKWVRTQYLEDGSNWTNWTTTSNGNKIQVNYNDAITGNPVEYTFDKYLTENISEWVSIKENDDNKYIYITNISPYEPLTFTAIENDENYTFVGWWNNKSGRFSDNSWTIPEGNDISITARFAKTTRQAINIHTYDPEQNKYIPIEDGGSVQITYSELTTNQSTGLNVITKDQIGTYTTPYNTTVTLKVTEQPGYTFVGWYNENGALVNLGTPTVNTDPNKPEERIFTYTFTATTSQQLTARFRTAVNKTFRIQGYDGTKKYYTPADLDKVTSNPALGTFTAKYYSGENKKEELVTKTINTNAVVGDAEILYGTEMILEATPKTEYDFIGWYNNRQDGWVCTDATWTSLTDTTQADITARFAKRIEIKPQIQTSLDMGTSYLKNAAGGSVNIKYYDGKVAPQSWAQGTTYTNNPQNSETNISPANNDQPIKVLKNSDIILEANTNSGYEFMGWYTSTGNTLMSSDPIYTLNTPNSQTVVARFKATKSQLTVSVLNYDTKYNEFREYEYEYNTITLKDQNGTPLATSYSSFSREFTGPTSVTLTATPEEGEDGYDFIGWYQNGEQISTATEIPVNVIGLQAISAHFAPKKCHKITLVPNSAGTYTIRFGKDTDTENMYSKESSLTNTVITYAPYRYFYTVSSAKPILGYKFVEMYSNGNINDNYSLGQSPGPQEEEQEIVVNFVRSEDQEVYLHLNDKWNHNTNQEYYVYATNVANSETAWFKMNSVDNGRLYKYTIPGNTYSHIAFAQGSSQPTGKVTDYTGNKTKLFTIPATRYNCMKLMSAYNSSINGYEDMWSEPPTEVGDFRLVYIEQTVTDKNNITVDYTFDDAGLIKKKANSQDIISLHIYNKVSEDGTIDGMNNPEVILQRCTAVDGESQWEDVERRMIFGPLRATDENVIRMPGRRNAAPTTVVYDNGIDNIKNNNQDNGSGVWNFVISQDDAGNATILANATERYTGDYYIRTTNAPGQYYQYTHPGNIMTYSAYAAKNSDYTDYFIRYVDINEDGTATAEPGKHPVIKFAIANDYSVYLNHEFMMTEERFKNDEYGVDKFAVDNGGAPNLPADASVRFGWDRVTNRLTRAYIANTTTKNNEYLVVEGTYIGNPSGDATYFTDNSNWLYTIDLSATTGATAKVKAKMNGQYQYFMGSESENETLISGNGEGSYPIRLLYDFKDDRFTTIYRPNAALSGPVNLETPVMIEREHNDAPTQIKFNQGANINVTTQSFDKPAYAVMTFLEEKLASKDITHHEKMFYWISFPFDVNISDVFGLGKYGKYWIMQRYDGAQRAASGLAQNNWKYITNTGDILYKNVGYVICLNYNQILQDQLFKSYGSNWGNLGEGKLSLYFPSKDVISPKDISLQTDPVVVELEAWKAGENIAWNHLNWHIIGVPSFADPTFSTTQGDVPFFYQYWHPTDGYAAVASTQVDFYAMHSYMVQYAGYIKWTSVVNTTPKSLAAKTSAEDKPVMLRLELQQAGSTIDRTYVQLRNDKGTLGFDLNLDLSKIINAGANIYSVVSGDQMAGNAIPKEETVLPIGVVTSAAGEYTFAMPRGTEGMLVELIDYEQGTAMNLLMSDYTVTLPKGTFDQRFALRLKPDKVATSVDNIGDGTTSEDAVRKLLIDGMLYMQRGNITYDAQGRIVFER